MYIAADEPQDVEVEVRKLSHETEKKEREVFPDMYWDGPLHIIKDNPQS